MLDEKQDEVQGDEEKDIETLFFEFINAIKALGSQPIKYGEQPNYEQKMLELKVLFDDYVAFCESGHEKEISKQEGMQK